MHRWGDQPSSARAARPPSRSRRNVLLKGECHAKTPPQAGRVGAAIAAAAVLASAPAIPASAESPDLPRIYTVTPSSEPGEIMDWSTVRIFDPKTLAVTKEMPTLGFKPHHFYPVPGQNFAYIAHFGGPGTPQAVEVFDMVRNEIVGTIPTGDGPRHINFSPDNRYAYTSNLEGGSITKIDI